MANTDLVITGMGVPTYSARGLRQSLQPIQQSSQLRRTVNGQLADLSDPLFRKYSSTITGNDQEPPAVDAIWPGQTVTVDCIAELAVQGTHGDGYAFGKTRVAGSVRAVGGFTFYRPRLVMRVTSFSVERDEWGASITWTLQLEEL